MGVGLPVYVAKRGDSPGMGLESSLGNLALGRARDSPMREARERILWDSILMRS